MINPRPDDPQAVRQFKRFEVDVMNYRFMSILFEAILIGLAFAIASTWSEVIVSASSLWLQDWAKPLQNLIAALFVTLVAILAALVAVYYLVYKPKERAIEMADRYNVPHSREAVLQPTRDTMFGLSSHIPMSRNMDI